MAILQRAEPCLASLLALLLVLVLSQTATRAAHEDGSSPDALSTLRFGRRKTLVMPGLPPVSTGLLLPLTPNMWASIRRRNPNFRHASVGFVPPFTGNGSSNGSGEGAAPRWTYLDRVDWQQRRMVRPVQNQASCAACWAMAAVAAVESLYAIATNSPPPAISTQRLLECAPNTPRTPALAGAGSGSNDTGGGGTWLDGCEGGWSAEALDFMAVTALPSAAAVPFIGARGTKNASRGSLCLQQQQQQQLQPAPPLVYADNSVPFTRRTPYKGPFSITMFEETGLEGYLGMILALQRQPVVAALEADQPSFIQYDGSFVYSDPSCFLNGLVDHSVLVIGYDLTDPTPHWIVLNSWGSWWGRWGTMRLAMAGGDGICGIHSMPALYPVITTPDPCFPINPCGGGKCGVDPGTGGNTCECPEGFRVTVNIDGSQSCALARRCGFSMVNPCDTGTCIDSTTSPGGYSCLCPPPTQRVNNTDGTQTCVVPPPPPPTNYWDTPGAGGGGESGGSGGNSGSSGGVGSGGVGSGNGASAGVRRVRVVEGMTCGMLALTFCIAVDQLQQTNPGMDCSKLEVGATVTVNTTAAATVCSLSYAASLGDTCASIVDLFNTSTSALLALNPQLDCTVPFSSSQSICVAAALTPLPRRCARWYTPQPGDTCPTIMRSVASPPLPPAHFIALNPGLSCSLLDQPNATVGAGVQVCVKAAPNWTGASKASLNIPENSQRVIAHIRFHPPTQSQFHTNSVSYSRSIISPSLSSLMALKQHDTFAPASHNTRSSRMIRQIKSSSFHREAAHTFDTIDLDKDGKISAHELATLLARLDNSLAESTPGRRGSSREAGGDLIGFAEDVIREADVDGDGMIDFEEFLLSARAGPSLLGEHSVSVASSDEEEDESDGGGNSEKDVREEDLFRAFEIFDLDGNGVICPKELRYVVGVLSGDDLTTEDCERMIKRVDQDGDGYVDYDEFKTMMAGVFD
ncbi:unnamed protein product [Closterium sp. Yama58-4]|nr:unnamed protein product [Closterium sp. Yama58-4]